MSSTFSLETKRLRLRPVTADDIDDLVALHDDPLVARYLGVRDRGWYEWRIEASAEEWKQRGHGFTAIVDPADGRFLGRTGLKYWPQFDETELGWVLRPEAHGKGYAAEAAAAVLQWGFERFDPPYLTAMIRPDNVASIAVAERLGMHPIRRDELLGDPVAVYASGPAAPPATRLTE
ncbi:MAG TPA: GNAT family N-acetyltransferase [Solirubrobacterales bacterium]|jgi:RimJ/RimL family protein N-acetyltransferase|nr:GNAT family N-acetyltransferase [Solirubrobacterales bacterium]